MTAVTKRHERVALILRGVRETLQSTPEARGDAVLQALEVRLINWFREENPMFDAHKFRQAARPEGWPHGKEGAT